MRLQHRKLLTPVNAQFLNNAEKLAAKAEEGRKKKEKACSPNNAILKVQSFVRDVISMIHCNIFHICTSHTDQKPKPGFGKHLDRNLWNAALWQNTILRRDRRCIHLSTYSSPTQPVFSTATEVVLTKDVCAAVKRRGSPGKALFCIYNGEARASSWSKQMRRSDKRKWLR